MIKTNIEEECFDRKLKKSATLIQSFFKGYKDRKAYKEVIEKRNKCARLIQYQWKK